MSAKPLYFRTPNEQVFNAVRTLVKAAGVGWPIPEWHLVQCHGVVVFFDAGAFWTPCEPCSRHAVTDSIAEIASILYRQPKPMLNGVPCSFGAEPDGPCVYVDRHPGLSWPLAQLRAIVAEADRLGIKE